MRNLGFLLLLLAIPGVAKDYYVDTKAGEGGNGSMKAPFRTIQQAADIMQAGDVCLIAPGVYPESIRPASSGTAGNPIIFKPVSPEGGVLITGADPVPVSAWKKRKGNLFRAQVDMDLDHENQVFLGNTMMFEARWPNTGNVLLEPSLSQMDEGTTPDLIVDEQLPDLDWKGASVWIHAYRYWSDWTTRVTGSEKHSLDIENVAPYPGPRRHVTAPGADFFIYGCLAAMDTINEWFYDDKEDYLYIYRPDGTLPIEPYYTKKRMTAFDLSDRSHIHVKNLEIYASTVETDRSSSHLILDGLKIKHAYHSSEANRYYGTQTDKGLSIEGTRCEVRNCEIAYNSGAGIALGGQYNLVYNCHIHDTDYIGTYASSVTLRGKGNIVSHCTLNRTGRSLIDYGNMYRSLIQFCNMYHSGMLTSDTGLTYGNVIEGDGSEVRYNWMHDNLDHHLDMGLYYDHGTQNILSHHNVIWGIGYSAFHINHYGYYHLAYHNTFTSERSGFTSRWGNQYGPDLHGCRFFNNIFSATSSTTAGNYAWGFNVQEYGDLSEFKYLKEGSECIDAGKLIPGINDDFQGDAPDLGAYELGGKDWKAGHDFINPPQLDTTRSKPLYRNRLVNSAFEHENHVKPWFTKGEVQVQRGSKNHTTPDTARIRMGNFSLKLGPGSEVSQKITGLEADSWYEFAAFIRGETEVRAYLGVRQNDGKEQHSMHMGRNAPKWNRVILHFRTAKDQTEATIFVKRPGYGEGELFVDDCGLVYLGGNN